MPDAMRESDETVESTLGSTVRRTSSCLGKKPVTEVQVIRTDKAYKKEDKRTKVSEKERN